MSFHGEGERYAKSLGYFFFSDGFKKQMCTPEFLKRVGAFDPEASIREYFDSPNAKELIDKMLYSDSMTRMPDHPNMILDRMTMAHGLEARAPLLDHKLAEYCAKIPVSMKVRGIQRRYIQMRLARKYLPPELLKRKKQGFSSFLTYLLEKEIRWLGEKLLLDSRLVSAGYLRREGIETLIAEHLARKKDHGNRLWLLCSAEIWYRMFIENQDREALRQGIGPAGD
jgi:asparagine synthase (glutamine-hydrolysing)